MARLVVEGEDLVVRLSWWEKAAARSRNVKVPLSAVSGVAVERDWWRALRGTRGRGTWIPAALSLGTRRHAEGKGFAALRPRGCAVCVELRAPCAFAHLAVSLPEADAEAVAQTVLRAVRAVPAVRARGDLQPAEDGADLT
jgi:hypothetical protein